MNVSDDGVIEFSNARDVESGEWFQNLFRECAVFVTRKVVDEIVVPFVQSSKER